MSWPSYDVTTVNGDQLWTNLGLRTDSLLSSHRQAAPRPTHVVQGGVWCEDDASGEILRCYYDPENTGVADYEVGAIHVDRQKMIGAAQADRTIEQLNLQKRTSIPTFTALEVGHVYFASDRPYFVRDAGATYAPAVILTASSTDYDRVELPLNAWVADATNPPTLTEKGLETGFLFDAVAEKLRGGCVIPAGYATGEDARLRIFTANNSAQDAGDHEKWTLTYLVTVPNNADAITDTPPSTVPLDIDRTGDEADGVLASGDFVIPNATLVAGARISFSIVPTALGGAGEVDSSLFLGALFLSPIGSKVTE